MINEHSAESFQSFEVYHHRLRCIQQDKTLQTSINVLIPWPNILVSVHIGRVLMRDFWMPSTQALIHFHYHSLEESDVHRLYQSAVSGQHTRHQEPPWSRCMKGMPSWQAALQNTWPDDNTVTAECIGEKLNHVDAYQDFSITELLLSFMLRVDLKGECTFDANTDSYDSTKIRPLVW